MFTKFRRREYILHACRTPNKSFLSFTCLGQLIFLAIHQVCVLVGVLMFVVNYGTRWSKCLSKDWYQGSKIYKPSLNILVKKKKIVVNTPQKVNNNNRKMVIIDIFQNLRHQTNQKHTWEEGRRFLKKLTVVYIQKRKISIFQKKKTKKNKSKA